MHHICARTPKRARLSSHHSGFDSLKPPNSPLTSTSEANDMIAEASLPAKRQHKLALQRALREVEEENTSLQAQYLEAQPALQAASAEIAACKALVEQTATRCEQWRAVHA